MTVLGIYTHTRTRICISTHIHIYTHTHTHIYTHTIQSKRRSTRQNRSKATNKRPAGRLHKDSSSWPCPPACMEWRHNFHKSMFACAQKTCMHENKYMHAFHNFDACKQILVTCMHFIILNNACLRACKKIHACIVKARVTTCVEDRSRIACQQQIAPRLRLFCNSKTSCCRTLS